jgi:hypothetical protein
MGIFIINLLATKGKGGYAYFLQKPFCFFVSFAKNNGCNPKVAPVFLIILVIIYIYSHLFIFASFSANGNSKQAREMAQCDVH